MPKKAAPGIRPDLLEMTERIVSAYASCNPMPVTAIPQLISTVHTALRDLTDERGADRVPAVPVAESVHDDFLVCLDDGRKVKLLRRHLKRALGMNEDEYRKRWDLPHDYPMVAPGYSRARQKIAHRHRLGKRTRTGGDQEDRAQR